MARLALSGSEWLDNWYDRIHDEETVKMMADMGINVAVTHFFKGMGQRFEQPQMDRTKDLVEKCHKHGIRVIGYTQFGSIFYETFLSEKEEARDWACKDPDGRPLTWCSTYWRWEPCANSEGWLEYLKNIVAYGLKEVRLDGCHFDNSHFGPCYCERCKRLFREYLRSRYTDPGSIRRRFGIDNFDHVEFPVSPLREAHDASRVKVVCPEIHEPVHQEWMRFRAKRFAEVYSDLNRHIKALNPEVVMLGNYSRWCRGPGWVDANGSRLPDVFPCHDYVFVENENVAGVGENGIVTHQIKALKMARAGNIPAFSTTGVRDRSNWKAETLAIDLAEAAVFGSVPGTTWALRPCYKEGKRFGVDVPEYKDVLGKYMGFFEKHSDLYVDAEEHADAAVLHCANSLALDPINCWRSRFGIEEILRAGHVPYRIIFDRDFSASSVVPVLIVADNGCMPDDLCEAIMGFVERGGKLLVTGRSGEFTETFGERTESIFKGILKHKNVAYLPDAPEKADLKEESQREAPVPAGAGRIISALDTFYGRSVSTDAPATVALERTRLPDGRELLHLINYGYEREKTQKVMLKPRRSPSKAVVFSPDTDAEGELGVKDGAMSVELNIYSVVAMSF